MFNKKPASETRTHSANAMAGSSTFSVFGADITIKGDVSATADLHVDGRIEGDISCASIVQGQTSEIVGAVTANSARLAGTVRGSINASELVILRTARIHGDVTYDALTIEQGAEVDGRFAHRTPNVAAGEDGEPRLTLAS